MISQLMYSVLNFAASKGLAEARIEASAKQRARKTGVRGETYAYWYPVSYTHLKTELSAGSTNEDFNEIHPVSAQPAFPRTPEPLRLSLIHI